MKNIENLKNVSVTILTKNSQLHLKEVLKSLSSFEEVVVYDTGSKDSTLDIARTFRNVKIVQSPFAGFGPSHNMASASASNDWILSIDSDEVVSLELVHAIAAMNLDEEVVYSFPRHNYFNGKFIKQCGWCPDRQNRLYNRTKTRFSDDQVHEGIIVSGMRLVAVDGAIVHYSYGSISDFLSKMQSYSSLFAEQYCGKRKSSLFTAIFHGFAAFLRTYLVKLGFLDGYEGYIISAYNAHTAYYKYLKLHEANQQLIRARDRIKRD